jgi:tRNA pseudouridine55 synthase
VHGWLVIDKPLGPTSSDVVGMVKRALRQGGYPKAKVGHGGTLDPLATGVLPVALGEATKLAGRMLDATKGYRFEIAFGTATATDDAEGEMVASSDVRPTTAKIAAILPCFTGAISQTPPAYSALKVDGKRAYALARSGETVELASRAVTIHQLTHVEDAVFDVTVSKGTYIRSLARDIARALGTVGHVSMLRRTKAGPFGLDAAITLDKLEALGQGRALEQALLPLTAGLDDIPVLAVDPAEADFLRRGGRLGGRPESHGLHLATTGSVPVALVEVSHLDVRVVRGFNL